MISDGISIGMSAKFCDFTDISKLQNFGLNFDITKGEIKKTAPERTDVQFWPRARIDALERRVLSLLRALKKFFSLLL